MGNIGLEYVNSLYNQSELVTEEPQPIYILHRDTIKTFLHEKKAIFSIYERLLAVLGIFVTIVVTLLSVSFKSFLGIPANVMEGIFIVSAILMFLWLIITIIKVVKNFSGIEVDILCEDLGKRGTIIKPVTKPVDN